jgi:hypothetical protein
MNLGARKATIPSMQGHSTSDFWGLPNGFMQVLIWCGPRWVRIWIQVDSTPWTPSQNRWPNGIEQTACHPELAWLTNIGKLTFVDPQVWKGLHINSNLLKPLTGCTDCLIVQGSGRAVHSVELVDFSQSQLDPDRPWSQNEEFTLITLRKQEKSFTEIAERLRRKEFQVVCKYLDIVPLPRSDSVPNPSSREPAMKEEISIYVLWVAYDPTSTDGNQSGWTVYSYIEIRCEGF